MDTNENRRRSRGIIAVAAASVASLIAAATLGGVGLAQTAVGLAQYQYGDKKVTVCHKGKVTITISRNALPAHLAHGDGMGTCAALKAKAQKAKAQKAKAEKAKAEKANAEKAKPEKAKGR